MYDDTEYGATGYDAIVMQDDFVEQMRAEAAINDNEPRHIPVKFFPVSEYKLTLATWRDGTHYEVIPF